MQPLLDALQEEPCYQPGPSAPMPQPEDWHQQLVWLEFPAGEAVRIVGLTTLILIGRNYNETASIDGKEGFLAQGLESKIRVQKPLFSALINLRDILPKRRGRIVSLYRDYDLEAPAVEPHVPKDAEEVKGYDSFPFPNLGSDYESEDWEEWERWFVDSSGFGSEGEPAYTIDQFKRELVRYHAKNPDHGYGIVGEGQFQVWVAAFSPVRIKQEN